LTPIFFKPLSCYRSSRNFSRRNITRQPPKLVDMQALNFSVDDMLRPLRIEWVTTHQRWCIRPSALVYARWRVHVTGKGYAQRTPFPGTAPVATLKSSQCQAPSNRLVDMAIYADVIHMAGVTDRKCVCGRCSKARRRAREGGQIGVFPVAAFPFKLVNEPVRSKIIHVLRVSAKRRVSGGRLRRRCRSPRSSG